MAGVASETAEFSTESATQAPTSSMRARRNRIRASATQLPWSMEVSENTQNAPSPEKRLAQFELGITLSLFFWPSLSLAVNNQWGGPDSSSKREWFAQTTIDLLKENPDADVEWVETFLLQVMLDEFEVNVDDDSGFEVAEQIMRLRKDCGKGDFAEVAAMKERWDARGGRDVVAGQFREEVRREEDDETDASEEDDEDEDGDGDVNMDEAPRLVRVKEKVIPEVDEDGFTKVSKKR